MYSYSPDEVIYFCFWIVTLHYIYGQRRRFDLTLCLQNKYTVPRPLADRSTQLGRIIIKRKFKLHRQEAACSSGVHWFSSQFFTTNLITVATTHRHTFSRHIGLPELRLEGRLICEAGMWSQCQLYFNTFWLNTSVFEHHSVEKAQAPYAITLTIAGYALSASCCIYFTHTLHRQFRLCRKISSP